MAQDKRKIRLRNIHKNILITALAGLVLFLAVVIIILINRRSPKLFHDVTINNQTFHLEVANTPTKHQTGLKYRKYLPERTGMLFIFNRPEIQHFWMRDTYLSLDIIFIDDQKHIINVCTMPPLTDERCKSDRPAQYVIELEAGSATRYGLQPGQAVSMNLSP